MNKSKKNLAVLCTAIFVILGMWVMLSVHCQAAETNNDEKQQPQTIRNPGRLRIPSIISTKMVSDGVMDTSSCRLWQVIPDGNSVCENVTGPTVLISENGEIDIMGEISLLHR